VFAAVMALVLGATGVFVYLRFSAELDNAIDAGLRSRANDLTAVIRDAGPGLGEEGKVIGRTESFAEILDASGLGLAIVRTVARAHGGEARAANAVGGGAEVWLTLPRRLASEEPLPRLSSAL
jgi:signal transduction histidine kinase